MCIVLVEASHMYAILKAACSMWRRRLLLEEVRRVQHLADPSQLSYGCEREDISAYLISIV